MPRSYIREGIGSMTIRTYSYDYYGKEKDTQTISLASRHSYEQRAFSGTTTPNYRTARSGKGFLPTNGCSDNFTKITGIDVVQTAKNARGQPTEVRFISYAFNPPGLPSVPSNSLNEAWSKLRRKVLDQDFNAPVALAEAGKTVDTIVDRANRIYRAYSSFRKGRLGDVAVNLGISPKTIHNTWLEYKYGWMPLLMDIHGGAKLLAERNVQRDIHTFRAVIKSDAPTNESSGDPFIRGKYNFVTKAWVTVRIRNPLVSTANRVGLLNPLLVAWELVPFSFVADWFVNIGDCIAEASAFNGVDILDAGSSTRVSLNGQMISRSQGTYDQPVRSRVEMHSYARAYGVRTFPTLMLKSNPLSLAKLTTSAALLRSLSGSGATRKLRV